MKTTLKDIFEAMTGEWDWFGLCCPQDNKYQTYSREISICNNVIYIAIESKTRGHGSCCDETEKDGEFSLADLLANKSWCKAVWGEEKVLSLPDVKEFSREGMEKVAQNKWIPYSKIAFQILQQQGKQEALNYIFLSMKK